MTGTKASHLSRTLQEDSSTQAADPHVILRDIYKDSNEKIAIEVTADAIYLRPEDTDETKVILLDSSDDEYEQIQEDVRKQIAKKIGMLVPTLGDSKKDMLLSYTLRVVERLARDQIVRVREMLAEELKSTPHAPENVIKQFAWDEDIRVSGPIIEYSPMLGDYELLDIIASSPIPGVLDCIARRKHVSEEVSDAIVQTEVMSAIGELLKNPGAQISEETMDSIVDKAPQFEMWHEPLVMRPELTIKTINRIAGFISSSLITEMEKSDKLDSETGKNLLQAVSSRLKQPHVDRARKAELRARDLFERDRLDQEVIADALDNGEVEFVEYALALHTDFSLEKVKKILEADNANAVTALAWKAGLSMRTAIKIQLRVSQIHHAKVLYAREGSDYPLSESQMQEYLDHFV